MVNIVGETGDIFESLVKLRKDAPVNIICAYFNINSHRYKYEHIVDLLQRNIVDILFLSETKLYDSFPDAIFNVHLANFILHRSDRNQHGNGVLAYMRADLAGDRNKQMEFHDIESIALEVTSEGHKWLFTGVYKPPSMLDNTFYTDFSLTTEKFVKDYDSFILMCDMNLNMLDDEKYSILKDSVIYFVLNKSNNKITELRIILQRESQNS